MNFLVLDTSTDGAAIGIWRGTGNLVQSEIDVPRRHGRDLIPRIQDVLKQAGLRPFELDVVAVGVGPGSYTGLRIGLAAAKTLAYVGEAAILGIDSLEGIAWNAPPDCLEVSVVGDAQRGECYAADFARDSSGSPILQRTSTHIEKIADWSERLKPGTLVMGPGLESPRIRSAVPAHARVGEPVLYRPTASSLVELAVSSWNRGQRDDLWTIEPNYLRRSAAEDQWDARQPKDAVTSIPIKS